MMAKNYLSRITFRLGSTTNQGKERGRGEEASLAITAAPLLTPSLLGELAGASEEEW